MAFRGVDTSRGSVVSYISRINITHGKKSSHEKIQQVTHKIRHGATCGHACKNEVVIEQYCNVRSL